MSTPKTKTISEMILRRMISWTPDVTYDQKKMERAIDELAEHLIDHFALHYAEKAKPMVLPGLPGA